MQTIFDEFGKLEIIADPADHDALIVTSYELMGGRYVPLVTETWSRDAFIWAYEFVPEV